MCTCKFMQANSWRHKLFHFHLFFWIWKVWKGRGKITKIWISQEQKELFRWNKKHFSQFLKGYHLLADTSFKRKECQFYILLNCVFYFEIIFSIYGFGFDAIFWGKTGNIVRSRCNPILTTSTEYVTMLWNFSLFLATLIGFGDQWFVIFENAVSKHSFPILVVFCSRSLPIYWYNVEVV